MNAKWRNISILIIAEIAAMTLWFVSAAIVGDMGREVPISSAAKAAMTSAVAAGFVAGALISAITGMADRFQPRWVFAISAALAALCNLLLLVAPIGGWLAIVLRGLTGAFLAGVYPVGMKIAVGWGQKDRGLLVGLLVGGLTLGSAAPHLLSFLGGAQWRITVVVASVLSVLSAVLVLLVRNGPYHSQASQFKATAVISAWTNLKVRRAYIGYLGHMWELYAMWGWIGVALAVSFSAQLDTTEAGQLAKITAFGVVGIGAFSSAIAGWLADRIGRAELTILALAVSGSSAVLFALTFGGSIGLTIAIALVWGFSVIPDSAQFSALVADYAPPQEVGSLLTFQTALGFALTVVTVQIAPVIAAKAGWPIVMASLALGPVVGIYSMLGLRRNSLKTNV